jgi:methylenetetrahydrofolate--tRNA-(uracil-5-)-methyltransferase
MNKLVIIGGGLAGSEAAWQASRLGCQVVLYEMKPLVYSPAHHSPLLAELVCSNSLRSDMKTSAVGLLEKHWLLTEKNSPNTLQKKFLKTNTSP